MNESTTSSEKEWTTVIEYPYCSPVSDLAKSVGWICPSCGRGNAPWLAQCSCIGGNATTSNASFDEDIDRLAAKYNRTKKSYTQEELEMLDAPDIISSLNEF